MTFLEIWHSLNEKNKSVNSVDKYKGGGGGGGGGFCPPPSYLRGACVLPFKKGGIVSGGLLSVPQLPHTKLTQTRQR